MARVTVEDCILKVPSRFKLVALAAQRSRQIVSGADLTIDRDNDKDTVVALREIADGTISPATLKESLIKKYQNVQILEEEDAVDPPIVEKDNVITSNEEDKDKKEGETNLISTMYCDEAEE